MRCAASAAAASSRANAAWGFDGGDAWTTAFAATWEEGAAWPTLAVGNYIDRREAMFPWGSCTDNWLHRPAPGGAGVRRARFHSIPSFCALSMLFTDWDRSGTPRLRVSNDREYYKGGQEQLWRIAPGEAPRALRARPTAGGRSGSGAWASPASDLDADGYPEYFLTNMADNQLQGLDPAAGQPPRPAYRRRGLRPRASPPSGRYVGDQVKPEHRLARRVRGREQRRPRRPLRRQGQRRRDARLRRCSTRTTCSLQGEDGTLRRDGRRRRRRQRPHRARRGADRLQPRRPRSTSSSSTAASGAELWRNVTPDAGHWIAVAPRRDGPNRDAVGGWIEVRAGDRVQRRELAVGGGHAGGQAGWWHFGLGDADAAEARVIWPDGSAGPWQTVEAGGFWLLAADATPVRLRPQAR